MKYKGQAEKIGHKRMIDFLIFFSALYFLATTFYTSTAAAAANNNRKATNAEVRSPLARKVTGRQQPDK